MARDILSLILCITALVSTQMVHAKIYKHVDANGNVFYSDKEPTSAEQTQVLDIDGNNSFTLNRKKRVIIGPADLKILTPKGLSTRPIHVFLPTMNELQDAQQDFKIGKYFYGKECTGPSNMNYSHIEGVHSRFLPDQRQLLSSVIKGLRSRGISSQPQVSKTLGENIRTEALLIEPSIESIYIEVCGKTLGRDRNFTQLDGTDFKSYKFSYAMIEANIKWRVANLSGETLGIYQSEGFGETIEKNRASADHMVSGVFQRTVENSAKNLLSDPSFTEHVFIEKTETKPIKAEPESMFSFQSTILLYTIAFILVLVLLQRVVTILNR
ncbi:Uncharacterised protein [BD1-7 clade bacterium]|nr:Uncharacterised protein [BD1-7 clade bacterium]